jgi:hypothetical protein
MKLSEEDAEARPFPMPGDTWVWLGNEMAPASSPKVVTGLRWSRGRAEVLFGTGSCAGIEHMMTLSEWQPVQAKAIGTTEADVVRRELLAARTELSQMRRLAGYADSDLVRLALSAWAALVDDHPDLARMLEDLPATFSNRPRRVLRRIAKANLEHGRALAGLADYWTTQPDAWTTFDPGRVDRLRREAMVRRFKGWVLLAAAKEAR